MRVGVWLALSCLACDAILGIEEPLDRPTDAASDSAGSGGIVGDAAFGGGAGGSTATGGSGASGGVTPNDAGDADVGPACEQKVLGVDAIADSFLPTDECGANNYGASPHANIGVGRGVIKFKLSSAMVDALSSMPSAVTKVTLLLARNVTCEGDPPACNGTRKTGGFRVYPLRNDWDEGTGADYSGANWCRRNAGGDPWASPGADQVGVDHGELAGQADINEAAIEASFKLDPTKWATWQTNNEISVLIVAGSGAMFVYATKESTMFAHPRLEVTTCE